MSSSSPFVKDEDAFGERPQAPPPPPPTPAQRKQHPPLAMDDIGKVNRNGQFRGMLVGIAAGISMAFLLRNKQPRKVAYMSTLATSVVFSYIGGYAYVREGMKKLQQRDITRAKTADEMSRLDMQAGQNPSFEAGVAGMHEFQDRTHSTRGDH